MVFGVVFLLVGIAGFFVTGFDNFAADSKDTLLIFEVNPLHNIVHLLLGIAGISLARTVDGARTYGLLPLSAGDGARLLGEMWDAVDAFCRDGQMLSLETPPEAKLFRRWFLEQFITQAQGAGPVSWPDYAQAHKG
jgi:hypothetical protein